MNMNTTAKELLTETMRRIDGAYSQSTIRAYKANFERFIEFCESMQASSLPANSGDIASYIKHLANSGLKSASIRIAIAAISSIHKLNQFSDPIQHPNVVIEMRRMHRTLGRASKQAFGITEDILEKMIGIAGNDLRGLRDRALILIAYDSLCRRSELVSLKVSDITASSHIRLRKSKTDQEAIGKYIRLNLRTQDFIRAWTGAAKIEDEFLFRGIANNGDVSKGINAGQINRIYKRLAKKAGFSQEIIQNISRHSFRVGAAQDLMTSGASLPMLMNRGRWSKPETAMQYVEFLPRGINSTLSSAPHEEHPPPFLAAL